MERPQLYGCHIFNILHPLTLTPWKAHLLPLLDFYQDSSLTQDEKEWFGHLTKDVKERHFLGGNPTFLPLSFLLSLFMITC